MLYIFFSNHTFIIISWYFAARTVPQYLFVLKETRKSVPIFIEIHEFIEIYGKICQNQLQPKAYADVANAMTDKLHVLKKHTIS